MHTHFMRNQPGQCRQIKRQQQHKTKSANNNKNSPTLEQHEEDVKHEKSPAEVFAMDIPFEAEPDPIKGLKIKARDSSLILNEEIGCDLSNNAASFLTSQKAAILHGHTTETNTLESLLLLNEEIGSDFMLDQSNHAASHLTSQKAAIPQQLLNEEIGCDFMFAQSNNAASHLTSQRAHMPQGLTTCTSTSPSATVHHSSDEQSRAFNRHVASMMTVPDSPPLLDRSSSLDLSSEIIKTFNFS